MLASPVAEARLVYFFLGQVPADDINNWWGYRNHRYRAAMGDDKSQKQQPTIPANT